MVSCVKRHGHVIFALVTILANVVYLSFIVCFIKNVEEFNPIKLILELAIPYIKDKMEISHYSQEEVEWFKIHSTSMQWHLFTFIELVVEVFTCVFVLLGSLCKVYDLFLPFIGLKLLIILKLIMVGSCFAYFLFGVDLLIALTWIMTLTIIVVFMFFCWIVTFQTYIKNFLLSYR